MRTKKSRIGLYGLSLFVIVTFQNCGQPGSISTVNDDDNKLAVCAGVSCTLDPLTDKPAVTTVLMALGDEADDQLVVNGTSAQLIAETVIRYTSPKTNPRILVVRDRAFRDEDPEDTVYVADELLKRYDVVYKEEPEGGLVAQDFSGFDVIWFNNPGYPMSSKTTRDSLMNFSGGVILQGDDLSRGDGFSLEELTGLKYIENGTAVACGDEVFAHDNNSGHQFHVTLSKSQFPLANNSNIKFRYGNDIDKSSVASSKVEVLAQAKGGPDVCTEDRPAIVRYLK